MSLEEICSWKEYATKNPDCEFYCLKCSGKEEENCLAYFIEDKNAMYKVTLDYNARERRKRNDK